MMASILPVLDFLGISILDLGRGTRQTDGQTDTATAHHFIMPSLYVGRVHKNSMDRQTQAVTRSVLLRCVSDFS